jgi:hypothetical protein
VFRDKVDRYFVNSLDEPPIYPFFSPTNGEKMLSGLRNIPFAGVKQQHVMKMESMRNEKTGEEIKFQGNERHGKSRAMSHQSSK